MTEIKVFFKVSFNNQYFNIVCHTPTPKANSSYSNSYSSTGQNITEEDDTALVPVNATSTNIPTAVDSTRYSVQYCIGAVLCHTHRDSKLQKTIPLDL